MGCPRTSLNGNSIALFQKLWLHRCGRLLLERQQHLEKGQGNPFAVIGGLADVIAEGQMQSGLLII